MENNTILNKEFEDCFNMYYSKVYSYFEKRISNADDAQDLTMEVFLKCWDKYNSFNPQKASMITWIFVVARNKLKNYYRDKKTFLDIDETGEAQDIEIDYEDEIIEAEYYTYMRKHIAKALELLPENQKQIVILKYYKNLSSYEIAVRLGLTAGNVRVLLSRGISKMQKYFKDNNIEWE